MLDFKHCTGNKFPVLAIPSARQYPQPGNTLSPRKERTEKRGLDPTNRGILAINGSLSDTERLLLYPQQSASRTHHLLPATLPWS